MLRPSFTTIAFLAGLASTAATASAQPASDALSPRLQQQLADDVEPVPAGRGAILIDSLTGRDREPGVLVLSGGERIAAGRTGERIVVPPGRYDVVVGHGVVAERARTTVDVFEGVTTPVPAFFGAIRVHLVDDDGRPVADDYVLSSLDRGTVYGPVSMGRDDDRTRVASWLVPPGKYRLVLGTDPESDEDAVSFVVHGGDVLRYRLVVEGGDVIRADLSDEDYEYEPSIWRLRWVVGGNAALDSRNNQLTTDGREYLLVSLFSQFQGGIDTGPHLALLNLDVNQSFVALDSDLGADIPFRTLNNEAQLELLYTYRALRVIGPYVRAAARTSFFESHYFPDTEVVTITQDEEGNELRRLAASRGDRVRLFEAGSPTVLRQGAGPSVTIVDNEIIDTGFRAGGGARQAFYRDGRFVEGRTGDDILLTQVDDRQQFGAEGYAWLGLRITRTISLRSTFDAFVSHEVFTGDEDRFPFRWDNRASLRLGRYASANYTFSLRRDEVVIDELQQLHGLSLTLQASIF